MKLIIIALLFPISFDIAAIELSENKLEKNIEEKYNKKVEKIEESLSNSINDFFKKRDDYCDKVD